ncbi:hypothetical protein Q7I60_08020 [Escherichia coli]|uniref:hypothetical protein n=1 Tax=Escherichia coli TaxID=562 RepID=UPI0023EB0A58|nr:hypothetical protein [Escherichia coli]
MTTNTNTPEAAEQDNIVPMDAMNDPINPPPTKKERDEYKKNSKKELANTSLVEQIWVETP